VGLGQERAKIVAMARFEGGSPLRGAGVGVVLAAAVVLVLAPGREHVGQAAPALALLVPLGVATVVGGLAAGAAVGVGSAVALDLVFIPPYGTLDVTRGADSATIGAFLLVGAVATLLVDALVRRRREAEHREHELRNLGDELARIDRDRERLTREAERAEDADRARSALLRSVSHDLRTPLSAILAIVSDLRDAPPYGEATRTELLSVVSDEVERLDRLVANLLSMSTIEAGALTPHRQAIDLHDLVDDRLRRLAPLFRELRVRTDLAEDLPLVDGDYGQLEQVLTNLLANLARHAPAGTDVWVVGRATDGEVRVEVSDRGEGVPDELRDRIFEPFQRGEGGGSSGIGLAICKAIVEAHGGTIHVERTFGGGATFAFTLPVHHGEVVSAS
jgi:K+-sensing histidine kinase KdpD